MFSSPRKEGLYRSHSEADTQHHHKHMGYSFDVGPSISEDKCEDQIPSNGRHPPAVTVSMEASYSEDDLPPPPPPPPESYEPEPITMTVHEPYKKTVEDSRHDRPIGISVKRHQYSKASTATTSSQGSASITSSRTEDSEEEVRRKVCVCSAFFYLFTITHYITKEMQLRPNTDHGSCSLRLMV